MKQVQLSPPYRQPSVGEEEWGILLLRLPLPCVLMKADEREEGILRPQPMCVDASRVEASPVRPSDRDECDIAVVRLSWWMSC